MTITEPSHPGPPQQTLDALVGKAVKRARLQASVTLSELSALSGVSTAMISKIERGQVSASLSTLDSLARAVGVPIINFFAETVELEDVSVVRAGEGMTVNRMGTTFGHVYRLLGRVETAEQVMETYLITLEAPVSGTPLFQHPGTELLYLVEGSLTYRVGQQAFDLEAGDALSFHATVPHGPVHMGTAQCKLLTVISRGD
ncbi:helix-turn-helix domain-containing protein [Rhizobium sp. G187]|uniref:helix-turn-helix domain-containing protein n=1 Tax=Rhizobium sp. G187 TaxID=3451352 RepID=UPI003EE7682A